MSDISDLIDFDFLLSADERALRDSVRVFVNSEIKPHIATWYVNAIFPLELVPELAKMGGMAAGDGRGGSDRLASD
jgi:glutaryl-CoA dehydrogenase